MKNIITIIGLLFISQAASAQAPGYDDLKILFADRNYDKLIKVAEKYTTNDKTKKHILPYIWLSKGLYKVSKSGNPDPKYKNAFKDAIKYLGKGWKYDIKYNEGSTIAEHREFIDDFQLSLIEVIENELGSGGFKRGFGWVIKYQKVSTEHVGVKYLMGACKYEDQDKSSARLYWKEARIGLDAMTGIEGFSDADKKNVEKWGLLYSAKSLIKSQQKDKAKEILNKAAHWFEDDAEWKENYDEIVNG